jgi:hypothetical protein
MTPHEAPSDSHVSGQQSQLPELVAVEEPVDPPSAHAPQSMIPPQSSQTTPHVTPDSAQVLGVHSPPSGGPPQSGSVDVELELAQRPQSCGQLLHVSPAAQTPSPHAPLLDADAVAEPELTQRPQSSVPPQPSGAPPHETPSDAHVAGTHVPALVDVTATELAPPLEDVEPEVDVGGELVVEVRSFEEPVLGSVVAALVAVPASAASLPTSTDPSHAAWARTKPTIGPRARASERFMRESFVATGGVTSPAPL